MTWTQIGDGAVNPTANDYALHVASEDLGSDSNTSVSAGDILGFTFDGYDIDGTNYASSSSYNKTSFTYSVAVEWS